MRAVVVTANGGPDVLELQDVPEPEPGPGDVLVDVEAVGVNYRDVYEREGLGSYSAPTPLVAGVELAGRVAAVGGPPPKAACAWSCRSPCRRAGRWPIPLN